MAGGPFQGPPRPPAAVAHRMVGRSATSATWCRRRGCGSTAPTRLRPKDETQRWPTGTADRMVYAEPCDARTITKRRVIAPVATRSELRPAAVQRRPAPYRHEDARRVAHRAGPPHHGAWAARATAVRRILSGRALRVIERRFVQRRRSLSGLRIASIRVMAPSLTTNESAARWPSPLWSTSPSRPLSLISIGSCADLRPSATHARATLAPARSGLREAVARCHIRLLGLVSGGGQTKREEQS
jgi:hypothetical protein